jgi:urease accessory protein
LAVVDRIAAAQLEGTISMLRATSLKSAGTWSGDSADAVLLSYNERHRRRIKMTGVRGLSFLLDLAQPVTLRMGDGLVLEDGRMVEIVAAPESLTEISCADATILVRIAWHLGNRHLEVQIVNGRLRIRRDHVIAEMLAALGARLVDIEAPFDPEAGAYKSAAHAHHHPGDHPSHLHDPAAVSARHHERIHVDSHPHLHALNDGPGDRLEERTAGEPHDSAADNH